MIKEHKSFNKFSSFKETQLGIFDKIVKLKKIKSKEPH